MTRHAPLAAVLAAAVLLPGCAFMRLAGTPMDTIDYAGLPSGGPVAPAVPATGAPDRENLFVLLPGFGNAAEAFDQGGFLDELRASGLEFDALAVDAHYGYYRDRTILDRLKADVIDPARERGYRNIWLVGVSMGGLGSLLYLMQHPADVQGVIALAPYLGQDEVVQEIADAGGLLEWTPGTEVDDDDFQRGLWKWMKGYLKEGQDRRPVYLSWGRTDRFAPALQMLAAHLEDGRATVLAGGHDWVTWRAAWKRLLGSPEVQARLEGGTPPDEKTARRSVAGRQPL